MIDFHKELVNDWTIEHLDAYIKELEARIDDTNKWLKYLKTLRKKKVRKHPVDTGARDGR